MEHQAPATGASSNTQLTNLSASPRRAPCSRPGYSRQNFWKSACSSFLALRKTLPFSVPTTKVLSSCTAMQATSAFSLESAEHCGDTAGSEPERCLASATRIHHQ